MLRKFNSLISWKSAVYLTVIVTGSFAINVFLPGLAYKSTLFFVLTAYAFLFFLNFVMSKIIFTLSIREAGLTGLLVGIVHTLMAVMATPVLN
jgi:membrane-anchored protein YejM (alkaline phosphatase superfamily)